jgi:hypothetical protein
MIAQRKSVIYDNAVFRGGSKAASLIYVVGCLPSNKDVLNPCCLQL